MKARSEIESLQILRGAAAWMVVFHHFTQVFLGLSYEDWLTQFFAGYGSFGVDIFFVLSGFVMYYSLSRRTTSAFAFLARRVARIVPAYWFFTGLLLLVVPAYTSPFWKTEWTAPSLVQSLFFVPHENPGSETMMPFLKVGWSLNFEMFFYGLLALCLLLAPKRKFIMAAILLTALPVLWPDGWKYTYILGSPKLLEFLIGLGLGAAYMRFSEFMHRSTMLGFSILAAAFALLVWGNLPYSRMICAGLVVVAALTVNLSAWPETLVRLGKHLGDISYSTYLGHVMVLNLVYSFGAGLGGVASTAITLALIVAATYLASLLGYRYVELPAMQFAKAVLNRSRRSALA